MKTTTYRRIVTSTLAAVLFSVAGAQAQISGINAGTSSATIKFNDTNSSLPPAGTTNVTQSAVAWNGMSFSPLFPTDPITSDFATATIASAFPGSPPNYSIGLSNVQLSQVNATAGFALLIFNFTVEYTVGIGGLLPGLTQFQNFLVSGTVGSSGGSFASITGSIDYYDASNAAYVNGLLDTVNYNYLNNTPGPFSNVTVPGVPVNGSLPFIPFGSNLTLVGNITFTVDPSSISAQSFPAPEPSSGLLALVTGLPLLLRRRRS